jgi:hypothetical protein
MSRGGLILILGSRYTKKEKEMKHIAWSEKKNVAHSHLFLVERKRGSFAHMRY